MFSNIFDAAAATAFRTTSNVMGYNAVWSPFDLPGTTYIRRVHFNDPSEAGNKNEHEKVDFQSREPHIEFFEGDFPGLMAAANNGKDEKISVERRAGVWTEYEVQTVIPIHDGQTYKAILVLA